jgi:hypothetical protein
MFMGYSCSSFYPVSFFAIPKAMQEKGHYFEII